MFLSKIEIERKVGRNRKESRMNGASVSSSGTVCCNMLLYAEELGIMASKNLLKEKWNQVKSERKIE